MGCTLEFGVCPISPEHFERFSLFHLNVNLSETMSRTFADSRPQFKIMGFTLEFRVCSISPEPFEWFSLYFTWMLLSLSWCAESMTQICKLKVKVTPQGHGILRRGIWLSSRLLSCSLIHWPWAGASVCHISCFKLKLHIGESFQDYSWILDFDRLTFHNRLTFYKSMSQKLNYVIIASLYFQFI